MADTASTREPEEAGTTATPAAPMRPAPRTDYARGKRIVRDGDGKIVGAVDDWIRTSDATSGGKDYEKVTAPPPFNVVVKIIRDSIEAVVAQTRQWRAEDHNVRAAEIRQVNQAFSDDRLQLQSIVTRLTMCERDVALKTADPRIDQVIAKLTELEQWIARLDALAHRLMVGPEEP
jgi:hypothetical protein